VPEAFTISHVAAHDRDEVAGQVLGAGRLAGKDTDREVAADETIDEQRAEPAGPAGDEDHDGPPDMTWRRTA
jgi:hypothetical protein